MRTLPALGVPLLALAAGCGTAFDPPSLVESVRLLAIRADKPYAAPGDVVSMEALAFDGRPSVPAGAPKMTVSWVPVVCPDPPGDSYFACYPGFAAALTPGVDLTSTLTAGTQFSFRVPDDILTAQAAPVSGAAHGLVVVFAIACAGHVQFVARRQDTLPPAPPLGCFDDTGTELGPDASVFAWAQVFSFADGRKNQNPVIDGLTFGGAAVDPVKGITVASCAAGGRCNASVLDTAVPAESQEENPAELSASGVPLHEEIWTDYFLTAGSVGGSALLYDATAGKLPDSTVKLTAPAAAGEQILWSVVRDNRGGVSWIQVPLHVQ